MTESSLARFGALSVGMMLLHRSSDVWNLVRPTTPHLGWFMIGVWFCLLGGLGLMAAAFLIKKPERLAIPLLVCVLLSQWILHAVFAVTEQARDAPSDTVSLSLEAGVLTWLGVNPYGYQMLDVLSAYDITGKSSTPHLGGGQVETLPYPPLHFLVLEPLLGWGLEGARAFYSLSFSLLIITVFLYAPPRYRCVVLLPLVINPELMHFPLYWASDTIWTLLLAWMLWSWNRPVPRAILLGLACSYKQTPWLFAPFLAMRILREEKRPWRALAIYTGLSVATFAAINLPFAWQDPRAWFQGTFDPMLSPYVALGRGFSMLMQTHILPFSKAYFSLLTWGTFALAIWFYALDFERLRPLLWWFPAAVLFFSYRSLPHYFVYSVPLLTMELSRFDPERPSKAPHRFWYAPLGVWALGFAFLTAFFWPGPPTASLRVLSRAPNAIRVEVSNHDSKALSPNFFVRLDWRVLPWNIRKGPVVLEPGQSGQYEIATDLGYRNLSGFTGGQIVVSDGKGDRGYRAVADLPALDWHRYSRAFVPPGPESWGQEGDVSFREDETVLAVRKTSPVAMVSRPVTLPFSPLSFELKRPEGFPLEASFGLDVRDQMGRRLSVFLGDRAGRGYYDPDHFYKILPSKTGWNSYKINLRDLYSEAGFPLPNLDRVVNLDVEMVDRPIILSFVLYSETAVLGAAVRNVQLDQPTVPGRRIAELLDRPQEYQAVLGDTAARRRRYEEALELYDRAWPMASPVRTTQEGSYLTIPGPCDYRGRFPMAGWGWGEPEGAGGRLARPLRELVGTIPVLAKPGLKMALEFEPPGPYAVRWDDEPWQQIRPGETFAVPDGVKIRVLSVIPERASGLARLRAEAAP